MTTCQDAIRQVAQVPPSVQTVYCTMYGKEPLTGAQIREETGLPRRTVYSALQRLRNLGLLHSQLSLRDTRQTFFWLEGPRAT